MGKTHEKNVYLFGLITLFIDNPCTKEKYRKNPTNFTRDRKLPFKTIILILLNMPKRTLSLELHDFFAYLGKGSKNLLCKVTSSAFSQRRQQLSPDVFPEINHLLTNEYYTDNEERVKQWEGFRLIAIDGSKINLPFSEELKAEYGWAKNQNPLEDVVQARASVLYDVLNEMVIDAMLVPSKQGEITLAYKHVQQIKPGDLLLLDRGYPSFHLAFDILEKGADFVFRCKPDFSNVTRNFIASGKEEAIVEITPKQNGSFKGLPYKANHRLKVRLIRILLDSGEIELLMTSLTDLEKYPYHCFKPLYFKRWRIETFYNRIKNILAMENFSGLNSIAIQQDFHCAIFISNAQSLILNEAMPRVIDACKERKHEYKINVSVSLGLMKYRIIDIFIYNNTEKALRILEEELITHLVPVKPNRSFPRDTEKYRKRTKPLMFKNRKKVI